MPIKAIGYCLLFALLMGIIAVPLGAENPLEKRVITVTLAIDESCSDKKEVPSARKVKKGLYESLIAEISADFEKEFALQFSIEKQVPWKSENMAQLSSDSLDSLFTYFTRVIPKGHNDMVIGFTCKKNLEGKDGISFYQEGYILIRRCDDRRFLKKVLKHEICHVFGATHVDDSDSLMDRFLRGNEIKGANREIILLHHDRDFKGGSPVPAHNSDRLVQLYKEIAGENERLTYSRLDPGKRKRLAKWLSSEKVTGLQQAVLKKEFLRLEDVYLCLALLYIELKKYPDTIAETQKVLRINPSLYEAYNVMGIALRRSGRIDEAISAYNNALEINPAYQRIYYNLGIAYTKKGEIQQAIAAYQKAVDGNPYLADAWNNLGTIYLEKGDIDKAVEHFKTAVEGNPYHSLAHANLAEALLQKGENHRALQYVQRALQLNDRLPGPHNIMGTMHSRLEKFPDAEKEFQTAISLDASYYKAYCNLGNVYVKTKRYPEAIKYFRKTISLNPGFANAYIGLGNTYMLNNQFQEAELAFRDGEANGYREADLYLNLSFIKIKQKKITDAIALADKALEINPHLAMAHYNRGIAFLMAGDSRKAEQAFINTITEKPEFNDAWSGLGDVYFQQQQLDKAQDSYIKSLQLDPANARVHNNLSVIYYFKKEFPLARRHIKEAEQLGFPVNPEFKKELENTSTSSQSEGSIRQ